MIRGRIYQAFLAAGVASLFLSACGGPQVSRGRRISTLRPPAAPLPDLRQCLAKLDREEVQYTPLPDRRFAGGCDAIGSVKLLDVGVPVTNLGAMTCPLASTFAAWARYGVLPAARVALGIEVVKIETMGTYACRPIAGSSKLSEHAHSNAVDVAAFLLADGRRISVKADWNAGGKEAKFLHVVHDSACKRFRTVLSPDYNADHHDHLHFDMGGRGGFCR